MRIFKISLMIAAFLCGGACSRRPNVDPLHVGRENVSVWLDATRSDIQEAFDSLDVNRSKIAFVQPVLYALEEGKIVLHPKIGVNTVDDIVFACNRREPHVAIRAVLGNVDQMGVHGDQVMKVLEDAELRESAIVKIIAIARDSRFSGVDIDWEGMSWERQSAFAEFIEELAPRVHSFNKTISVALEPGFRMVQAKRIGAVADRVELLAYPHHHPQTGPGPISSFERDKIEIENALRFIPRSRLVFCLPLYGYIWTDWKPNDGTVQYPVGEFTWRWWMERLRMKGTPDLGYDLVQSRDNEGNPQAEFKAYPKGSPSQKVAFYEDAPSIRRKMVMAQEQRISQFGFWRIGGEDPAIWRGLNGK